MVYNFSNGLNVKKIINPSFLFWVIGSVTLAVILYYRLIEGINRAYSLPNEHSQFHFVYLMYRGLVPYRDFFNIYPPLFPLTLLPIFLTVGENFAALTYSRVVIFFFNLAGFFFTFKITEILSNKKLALVAVLIAASLPMAIEKGIEARPDNLMIPLFMAGLYFFLRALRGGKRGDFFAGGAFFMLSFLTLPKIIFTVAGLMAGVILLGIFNQMIRKQIVIGSVPFIFGNMVVFGLFSLYLLLSGNIIEAFRAIFYYSRVTVSGLQFGIEISPTYWFLPHLDSVYGSYQGVSWYLNTAIFVIAIIGFISTILSKKKKLTDYLTILLIFPTVTSFAYLYFILRAFLQYLLPFFSLIPIWATLGLSFLASLTAKTKPVKVSEKIIWAGYIIVCILSAYSIYESWSVKRIRYDGNDSSDRNLVNYVLATSNRNDIFWGENSIYIFRLDGYPVYYDFEALLKVKHLYPPFMTTLEANKTKYLQFSSSALIKREWPFNNVELDEFSEWVKRNYKPTSFDNLWVRK